MGGLILKYYEGTKLGIGHMIDGSKRTIFDKYKYIEALAADENLDFADAQEFFEYNIEGVCFVDDIPIFI